MGDISSTDLPESGVDTCWCEVKDSPGEEGEREELWAERPSESHGGMVYAFEAGGGGVIDSW
jgi:hypothetical protein